MSNIPNVTFNLWNEKYAMNFHAFDRSIFILNNSEKFSKSSVEELEKIIENHPYLKMCLKELYTQLPTKLENFKLLYEKKYSKDYFKYYMKNKNVKESTIEKIPELMKETFKELKLDSKYELYIYENEYYNFKIKEK